MKIKNHIHLHLAVLLLNFIYIFAFVCVDTLHAGSIEQPSNYGLTSEQHTRYIGAIHQYMSDLNQTCRYPQIPERSMRLPAQYFDLMESDRLPGYLSVTYLKYGQSICEALDALRKPANDKHLIDCTLAVAFTYLHGARAVFDNDILFDVIYELLTEEHLRKYKARPTIKEFTPAYFLTEGGMAASGSFFYLKQLNDTECFSFVKTGEIGNLKQLCKSVTERVGFNKDIGVYCTKHISKCLQGINTIMVSPKTCLFFEPNIGEMSLVSAANMLIDDMDTDMTAAEIKNLRCDDSAVKMFNSIKYKNRDIAARQILSQAIYQTPNFAEVFKYVCVLWMRKYVPNEVRAVIKDEQNGISKSQRYQNLLKAVLERLSIHETKMNNISVAA
jgi:hypothetical protein